MSVTVLAVVGTVIILALASYAGYLLLALKKQKEERAIKIRELQEKQQRQRDYIIESLQVISANVLDEDLNLSEATIRCKMLLDALMLDAEARQPYVVLDEVFEQIQYFDTHQARKALSKDERQKQDKARESIEAQYQNALKECFAELRKFSL